MYSPSVRTLIVPGNKKRRLATALDAETEKSRSFEVEIACLNPASSKNSLTLRLLHFLFYSPCIFPSIRSLSYSIGNGIPKQPSTTLSNPKRCLALQVTGLHTFAQRIINILYYLPFNHLNLNLYLNATAN